MTNDKQVGGTHYRDMPIEPAHFCMVNRWDCDASFALKHLSRFRTKGGMLDLQKALHYVEMRQDDIAHCWEPAWVIGIGKYIHDNDIASPEGEALRALTLWVYKYDTYDNAHLAIAKLMVTYGDELLKEAINQ